MFLALLACAPDPCEADTADPTFLRVRFDHQESSGTYDIAVDWDDESEICQVQWSEATSSCAGTGGPIEVWIDAYDIGGFEISGEAPGEVRIEVERDGELLYDEVLVPDYATSDCPGATGAWAEESVAF